MKASNSLWREEKIESPFPELVREIEIYETEIELRKKASWMRSYLPKLVCDAVPMDSAMTTASAGMVKRPKPCHTHPAKQN